MKKWSGLNQERNLLRSSNVYKPAKTVLNKYVGVFWCERQQEIDFFTGGSIIMDCGFKKLKTFWWICFLQTQAFLASQDVNKWCGLHCDVFISCLDSHSNGTHSLQRIHWSAMECDNSPNLVKKKLSSVLYGLRVRTFLAHFHFCVNYFFKCPDTSCSHCFTTNQHNIIYLCFCDYWCSAVVCVAHSSSDDRDNVWWEQMKFLLVSVRLEYQWRTDDSAALVSFNLSCHLCYGWRRVRESMSTQHCDVTHCVIIIFT